MEEEKGNSSLVCLRDMLLLGEIVNRIRVSFHPQKVVHPEYDLQHHKNDAPKEYCKHR